MSRWCLGGVFALLALEMGCHGLESPDNLEALTQGSAASGRSIVARAGCGSCHRIPEIPGARGKVGPSLEGVARRSVLAGRLPNSPEAMSRWVRHPREEVPGTLMPDLGLSEDEARNVAAFLYTVGQ